MNSTIKMSRIHLLIESKYLMVSRCFYIVQGYYRKFSLTNPIEFLSREIAVILL